MHFCKSRFEVKSSLSIFVLILALLLGQVCLMAKEDQAPAPKTSLEQKVAIMAYHEPRDIVFYDDMRRHLYEKYSLRALRVLHRLTGVPLDKSPSHFQILGSVFIFVITFCVFLGFVYKRKRWLLGTLASMALMGFAFLIYIFSGVAALNQYDMKDPLHAQKLIDALVMRGIPFDVYWDWEAFKKKWDESESQAYHAIAWAGIPLGGDEIQIEEWLKDHKEVNLLHMCLGAHLPAMFHPAVFQGQESELKWNPGTAESICEPQSAYERHVSWCEKGRDPVAGLFFGSGYKVLYLPTTLGALDIDRLYREAVFQDQNLVSFYLNMSDQMALRMDDPGSALAAHLDRWRLPTLSEDTWRSLEQYLLNIKAHLTVAYVGGWVDDGDEKRGTLYHLGKKVTERIPGKIYPSHELRYEHHKEGWYELQKQAEYLKASKTFETELHGYTHISPNIDAWLKARNQDGEADWYREFLGTEQRPFVQRPREVQENLIDLAQQMHLKAFERKAKVMVPPGHAISWDTAEICVAKNLWGMCGRSLVIEKDGIHRRSRLIASFDLNNIDESNVASLSRVAPKVAVLHDIDIHRHGVTWLQAKLSMLKARRWLSVRELTAMVKFVPEVNINVQNHQLKLSFPAVDLDPLPEHWQQKFNISLPYGLKFKNPPAELDVKTKTYTRKMSQIPETVILELESMQ